MKYYESNPQTLLLVNPSKPKARSKAKSKPKTKPKASPKASPKAASELNKVKRQLAAAKKATKKAKAEATKARRQAKSSKQEVKKVMAQRNPNKITRTRKRSLRGAIDEVAKRKKVIKPRITREQKFISDPAVKQAASALGMSPTEAFNRFGTKKGLLTTAKIASGGMYRAPKVKIKKGYRSSENRTKYARQLGMAVADTAGMTVAELRTKAAERRKKVSTRKKAKKAARRHEKLSKSWYAIGKRLQMPAQKAKQQYGTLAAAKAVLSQARGPSLPRGTKVSSLPGYETAMKKAPKRPTKRPLEPDVRHMAVEYPWRQPIVGKADSGWYWMPPVPAKGGRYKFVENPKRRKRVKTKQTGLAKTLKKVPIIGKPLVKVLPKSLKVKKSGRRNPSFSLGEIAKITIAGGAGYIGGGITNNFSLGLAETVGLQGMPAAVAGGLGTVIVGHMLIKESDYYVPVMSGVGIAVLQGILAARSMDLEDVTMKGDTFVGSIIDRVKGVFGGGTAMEGASDDQLLSSIDASAALGEYVDIAPMGEYVGIPMEEYVDVSPMGDSWNIPDAAIDPSLREYVDIPMEEYVDVSPMGEYEELADDDVIALSSDYSSNSVPYGELDPEEIRDLSGGYEELASFEELADDYEGLADDFEELGATASSIAARNTARSLRGKSGQAVVPSLIKSRRNLLERNGRQAWGQKLRKFQVAQGFRKGVQASVVEATINTPFKTGSQKHFRAAYQVFAKSVGAKVPQDAKRAFLVAYRAATQGEGAALQAARAAGVPLSVAEDIAPAPAPSVAAVARGYESPGQVTNVGGALVRRVNNIQPRARRVRRAGEGTPGRFGGIFRNSIFGRRGRWRNY